MNDLLETILVTIVGLLVGIPLLILIVTSPPRGYTAPRASGKLPKVPRGPAPGSSAK